MTIPWEVLEEAVNKDIKTMSELIKMLPAKEEDYLLDVTRASKGDVDLEMVKGAPLRALRQLLDRKDPHQIWGGLKKVLTPEGHYLWLCEHHAQDYLK